MADTADQLEEAVGLLSASTRPDVRGAAMEFFLGLTGSDDGRQFLKSNPRYLSAIVGVVDDEVQLIAKDALMALVNISTDASLAEQLLKLETHPDLSKNLVEYILKQDSPYADIACMILSNLTRTDVTAGIVLQLMIEHKETIGIDKVIAVFCKEGYNEKANLHYLGPFLCNLTQLPEARKYVLDKERCVVQRLLPYTQYEASLVRRGGIVGVLRNCCFETEYHEWLLSDVVDLLPRLLLPLAGPEEFDDEDNEKLPEELQYLEPTKTRDSDPDIRKMLVETVHQLCATKPGRLYVKNKNTYIIIRELHQWESDPAARIAAENLIHLLIGDEPEPGMENLREVVIPEKIEQKLTEELKKEQEEIERETNLLENQGKTDGT